MADAGQADKTLEPRNGCQSKADKAACDEILPSILDKMSRGCRNAKARNRDTEESWLQNLARRLNTQKPPYARRAAVARGGCNAAANLS